MSKKPKSNQYWSKRAELRENESMYLTEKTLQRIHKEYERVYASMHKEISLLYAKYATDNGLTLAEAKQRITAKEKQDLLVSLEEYIKLFENNAGQYDEMLDRISTRLRISRLEALTYQLDVLNDLLFEKELAEVSENFGKVYNDAYYKKIFDIQQRASFGQPFATIDTNVQNTVTAYKSLVDPNNFSKRLWHDTAKMTNEWKKIIEVGLSKGSSLHEMTKQLSKRTDVAYSRAKTLVRTETSEIHNKATLDAYREMEVEKYEFVAVLDSSTTHICQELDLEQFPVSEAEVGVNYPPMHYNCRSTTVEVLPDWLNEIAGDEERSARDDSGKTYKVHSDMAYDEWYNKYVEANDVEEAYNTAKKAEPEITKDLQSIAKTTGTKLDGLEYKLKTKESLQRKVNSDFSAYGGKFTKREVVNKITDINRYTAIFPEKEFYNKYINFVGEMTAKGHKLIRSKNTWLDKLNPYKGVNCNFIAPNGQKYELQFHTRRSFELKNGEMHKLYEEFRSVETSAYQREKLRRRMFELSNRLKRPVGIEKIK